MSHTLARGTRRRVDDGRFRMDLQELARLIAEGEKSSDSRAAGKTKLTACSAPSHCRATGFSAPEFYLNMLGDSIGRYVPTTSNGSHRYEHGAFTMGTLRTYVPPWYKLLWSK